MITTAKKSEPKGKVRSVTIRVADNGFTVDCDREPVKTSKDKGMMYDYHPPKPTVFEDGQKALDYVAGELGISTDEGDEEE
jgi:hypothetical protein